MINAVLATIRRKASFLSRKVLTEIAGSALAIVAVTTLSSQWQGAPPEGFTPAPSYRPTVDPATGKIVDRLSSDTTVAVRIGRTSIATFVTAPNFIALTDIGSWAASSQRGEATGKIHGHAIGAPAAPELQRPALAEFVPLPPTRPMLTKIAAASIVVAPPTNEEQKPDRLQQVAGWFSPGRVVESGTKVFSSSRDVVYRAVSYGGSALSRIYP